MYEQRFMDRVIELSREAVERPGTQPFGALVVRDGEVVGEGLNHALAHNDPTAHGEVEAIRNACQRLQQPRLDGCVMYAIGEPCPMCTVALRLAGIAHLYYGATHADASEAFAPLADTAFRDIGVEGLRVEAGKPIEERVLPASQHDRQACAEVYNEWAGHQASQS
ncbi:nucleoside deaminase [Allohahella marinimesophila]|uniref:Nucleoside deaminase n=1 Tax=Allohahella marinimesophila TaxID=1054972 RepID=A0ABP7NSC0_9GAMM